MVYAFTQDVPIDDAMYEKIMANLGPEPMDGCVVHLCVRRADGGLRYIDVWESEAQCTAAFEQRIHPAVDQAFGGSRPAQEPRVEHLEVLDAAGSAFAG